MKGDFATVVPVQPGTGVGSGAPFGWILGTEGSPKCAKGTFGKAIVRRNGLGYAGMKDWGSIQEIPGLGPPCSFVPDPAGKSPGRGPTCPYVQRLFSVFVIK